MKKKSEKKKFWKKPKFYIPIIVTIFVGLFLGGNLIIKQNQIGNNNQQIIGNNNIQSKGDIIILNGVEIFQDPKNMTPVLEFGLRNLFELKITKNEKPYSMKPNFYNMKLTLPTGQEIFFDEFLYNQSIIFGLCSEDKNVCYIFPEYRYDQKKDKVCLDALLDESWGSSISIKDTKETENRASCVQNSETNIFLSECESI